MITGIKQRLRILQDTLHLTQKDLSKTGGRTRISYAEYIRENNPSTPGADFIGNLVENRGVNANWLLTGQGEMFKSEVPAVEAGEWLELYNKVPKEKRVLLLALAKALAEAGKNR